MNSLRALFSIALVALQLVPIQSLACGRFVPLDADGLPFIKDETSVIVWDAEKGIEHFIRQVNFDKAPAHFAFVIPVPNVPEFAEAPANLIRWIQAEMPLSRGEGSMGGGSGSRGAKGGVQILKSQDVAGLNATVVRSSSPTELQEWLVKNKYQVPPDAASWIKHYVDKKWMFVALKIKPKAKLAGKKTSVASPMLRISFATPKPFFPYREFDSRKAEPGREFHLYLIAPSVLSGYYEIDRKPWTNTFPNTKALSIGEKAKFTKKGYVWEVSELEKFLDGLLGKRKSSQNLFITHFVNYDDRRPYAEDLYFDSK